jgi:hypothetical protein
VTVLAKRSKRFSTLFEFPISDKSKLIATINYIMYTKQHQSFAHYQFLSTSRLFKMLLFGRRTLFDMKNGSLCGKVEHNRTFCQFLKLRKDLIFKRKQLNSINLKVTVVIVPDMVCFRISSIINEARMMKIRQKKNC